MQAAYGSAQDRVYFLFGQTEQTAIKDGAHDLSVADHFEKIGIGLLVGVFALVLAIMLYFARRLTTDVVRPVELLQLADASSSAPDRLDHRIDLSTLRRVPTRSMISPARSTRWPAPWTSAMASSRGGPRSTV